MFKKLAIVFIAVFCVLLAVPTMAPNLAPYFPKWIEPVPLGLDLKGGAQLLLEVDTNTMFQEKAQQLYDETRSALIDRNKGVIRFSNLRNHDGVVSLVVRNEDEVSNAKGRLKASFGNTVNMTSAQVISAINQGNQALSSQLAQCCCDNKLLVTTQGYENRIATAEQTAILAGKLDAQTTLINDKFCQLEMREMQNKIDALRDEKLALQTNISQRAQNEYIATSLYPIATALTELRADFDCFKSHLPETVSVPYSPITAVPNCVAYQYGFGPYAGFGFPGNGSF
mgnify:CR=1 FL=1